MKNRERNKVRKSKKMMMETAIPTVLYPVAENSIDSLRRQSRRFLFAAFEMMPTLAM